MSHPFPLYRYCFFSLLVFLLFPSIHPAYAASAFADGTATYGIADSTTAHRAAVWADVDNDGDLDLYSINNGANNKLYQNNGAGVAFTDVTATYGVGDGTVVHQSASWIDTDNDGDPDLYTSNLGSNNHLFINNGAGIAMTDATATYGLAGGTANHYISSWVDVDNDGDLDALIEPDVSTSTKLYKNNGVGLAFTDVTALYGLDHLFESFIGGAGMAWGDIDNDGDPDLMTSGVLKIYQNNGPNSAMTDVTSAYGLGSITVYPNSEHLVDVDNDEDLDIYISTSNCCGPNSLFINNGPGTAMTNATTTYGITGGTGLGYQSLWFDIDNDGDLDLYTIKQSSNNKLLINNGLNTLFTDATATYSLGDSTTAHRAASIIDIDNDGDLDIYSVNSAANNKLYINPGQENNYLKLKINNDSGLHQYNARIEVDLDGNNDFSTSGDYFMQYQTDATYGGLSAWYSGSSPVPVFFGLGSSSECIYDVRVFLPGVSPSASASYSQENICPNQSVTVPFVSGIFAVASPTPTPTNTPTPTPTPPLSAPSTPWESSSAPAPAVESGGGGTISGGTDTSVIVEEGAVPFASNLSSTSISSHDAPVGIRTASCGVGDIHQIWLTDFYNKANILSSVQNKPSIVALHYNEFQLLKSGGGSVPESALKISYSPDGITWTTLPTSVVDTVNNTVAALHKIGGYYMITSCGGRLGTGSRLLGTSIPVGTSLGVTDDTSSEDELDISTTRTTTPETFEPPKKPEAGNSTPSHFSILEKIIEIVKNIFK